MHGRRTHLVEVGVLVSHREGMQLDRVRRRISGSEAIHEKTLSDALLANTRRTETALDTVTGMGEAAVNWPARRHHPGRKLSVLRKLLQGYASTLFDVEA